MAQSVERLTLDFGSGHDLTVCEFEPHVRLCADSMGPAWDSLPPSLSLSLSLGLLSLSLPISKYINIKKKKSSSGKIHGKSQNVFPALTVGGFPVTGC